MTIEGSNVQDSREVGDLARPDRSMRDMDDWSQDSPVA